MFEEYLHLKLKTYILAGFFATGLMILGGGLSSAFAYVLSSAQIMEQYLDIVGRVETLEARQKLVFFDPRIQEGTVEFDETALYSFPSRYRSDIVATTTSKTMISTFDKSLVLLDGAVAADHESGFDYYKDVLLYRNRLMLSTRLRHLGIDLGATRLTRFQGRIVYAIGKKSEFGEPVPGLWVDKETFLPIRLLMLTGSQDGEHHVLEVLFLDWKKYIKTLFPSRIEFYRDQTLAREVKVEKIMTDVPIDESLFDVEAVRREHTVIEAPPSPTDGQNTLEKDTRKTIDDLDKIIEKDPLAF